MFAGAERRHSGPDLEIGLGNGPTKLVCPDWCKTKGRVGYFETAA